MNLQNHIHLSTSLGIAPENAPDETWKVINRIDSHRVIVAADRALQGRLYSQPLLSGLVPRQFQDWEIVIRVRETATQTVTQRIEHLQSMAGQTCYFIDNFHADDGADHTADIQSVVMQIAGPILSESLSLSFLDVTIQLMDAT